MFRRRPETLPEDLRFPTNLEQLGFFITDKDQIRRIKNPEDKYHFLVNRNDRVNEVYKHAMNACVRREVTQRLSALGLQTMRLPLGSTEDINHVPILMSSDIESKQRVVVVFGERSLEAGVFSYRVIGDEGINIGSAVNFATAIVRGPYAEAGDNQPIVSGNQLPGLVITNPGQLYWYRGGKRAVSWHEWQALPRKTAVHDTFRFDEIKNKIPENGDYREHVKYIFENVLDGMLGSDVMLDIIGLETTGTAVLEYLADNWTFWSDRVSAVCLGDPQHNINELAMTCGAPQSFVDFVRKRCRAYLVGDQPVETPLRVAEEFGCNCYASGEEFYHENIIIRSWGSMLDWFGLVHTLPGYEEPAFVDEDEPPN